MLTFPPSVRIYVALDPVDMRKSHHGLAVIVREQIGLDPLSGHLVFFTNRRRNLAKILFFDRTGLALLYKRLERGTFQLPEVEEGATRAEIDPYEYLVWAMTRVVPHSTNRGLAASDLTPAAYKAAQEVEAP